MGQKTIYICTSLLLITTNNIGKIWVKDLLMNIYVAWGSRNWNYLGKLTTKRISPTKLLDGKVPWGNINAPL